MIKVNNLAKEGREKIKLKRNREEKSGQQQRELELGKIWGLFNLYLVMVAVMLLVRPRCV